MIALIKIASQVKKQLYLHYDNFANHVLASHSKYKLVLFKQDVAICVD